MKIKDYIDGLFFLIIGESSKEFTMRTKVFIVVFFILIVALGFLLVE